MKIVQSFKEFLTEAQYKTNISDEEAMALLKTECGDALENGLKTPIMRGMSSNNSSMIIQGDAGERKSANTQNYYTIFLDTTLPKLGYPKRSASVICANWENKGHSDGFGSNLFAIVPFDGVKIGVCPNFDMWETKFTQGIKDLIGKKIHSINYSMHLAQVPQTTLEEIAEFIEKLFDNQKSDKNLNTRDQTWLLEYFTEGKVKEQIQETYNESMGFELETTKTIYEFDGKHELWIGGKCVAIPIERYMKLIKDM